MITLKDFNNCEHQSCQWIKLSEIKVEKYKIVNKQTNKSSFVSNAEVHDALNKTGSVVTRQLVLFPKLGLDV